MIVLYKFLIIFIIFNYLKYYLFLILYLVNNFIYSTDKLTFRTIY